MLSGSCMHGSCGKAGTHIEGDRLMPRFIILLSLMMCVAVATIVSGPRPVHAANNVLKFGIATPLSGPAAAWGIPHKQATELVFDAINSQGGLEVAGKQYTVEVVAYDHKSTIRLKARIG
jgi:ABC-type branched-subunit amino acid transport system substrate-binding protein